MIPDWVWWGGGIVGAGLILWFGSRVFGWKIGAILAAAFLAAGAWRGSVAKAEQRGSDEARRRQREADDDAIRRGNAARERARENTARTEGAINEDDPFLRD